MGPFLITLGTVVMIETLSLLSPVTGSFRRHQRPANTKIPFDVGVIVNGRPFFAPAAFGQGRGLSRNNGQCHLSSMNGAFQCFTTRPSFG